MQTRPSENKQPDNQSLPNTKVLRGFLHLYKKVRAPDRNGYFASFGKKVGYETAEVKLDRVVSEIESKIDDALVFDDFYNLIFILREKAEFADSQRSWSERSLLSVTLHAMADYIIANLSGNDIYYGKVETLKKDVSSNISHIQWDMENRHGKGTLALENKIDSSLKKLAYLADNTFCYQARRYHLLDSYSLITEDDRLKWKNNELICSFTNVFNEVLPLQLQSLYCQFIYALEYQPHTKFDYNTFVDKAKKNELIAINLPDNSIEEKPLVSLGKSTTNEEQPKQTEAQPTIPLNIPEKPITSTVINNNTPPKATVNKGSTISPVSMFKSQEKPEDEPLVKIIENPSSVEVIENTESKEQKSSFTIQ